MESPIILNKSLESSHDLSKGERSYLKEQGISSTDFDRLPPTAQREWKEECKNPAYESMRGYGRKKYL